MSSSIRGLSRLLTGAAFVAFALLAPNCQPSGGDPTAGTGGSGDGGSGDGGSNTGGTTAKGGSGGHSDTGGTSDTGGSSETGGSNSGGSAKGGSGGSAKGGSGGSAKGGSGGSNSGGSSNTGGTSNSGGSSHTGGTSNTGGTSDTGGSSPPAGGSGGSSSGARKCEPKTATTPAITSTGGLACPGGLCTVGTYGGYLYVYADGSPSKVCSAADSLCASGSTGAADTKGTIWGAGVGFNLDKTDPPVAVELKGTGITYALSAMPAQGMRIQVTVAGTDYCVPLKAASGTVAWADFNTACWDNSGTKLAGAPSTPHVAFQVTAATAAGNFDFCVKSVSFE